MAWATEVEADSITGVAVTGEVLAAAQGIVETLVDRTDADHTSRISARDLSRLKKAVAFQAAHLQGLADRDGGSLAAVLSDRPVRRESFREGSREYADAGAGSGGGSPAGSSLAGLVAPLAAAAVRRVSWMATKTLDPLNLERRSERDGDDPRDDEWTPL